ncbi:unnamed protein product [Prunus armeniaca]
MELTIVNYLQGLFGDTGLVDDYRLLPHLFPRLADMDLEGLCSADINETLIALVPKVERPVSMTQLRPISLCNTLYKVISKILVARLRPCMASLVSPNQVSFVPGRQIVDNIVVAQEMLHKFKSSKGRKGFIAWKIDLSKAYDRLNWDFIREVLWEVGIRGRLSHIIQQSVQDKAWKPVQICQSGPVISHLFFADDLILFGEASVNQATVMKKCLYDFCRLFGQKDIATICGSPLSTCLGKYLGVPLIHTQVTKGGVSNSNF